MDWVMADGVVVSEWATHFREGQQMNRISLRDRCFFIAIDKIDIPVKPATKANTEPLEAWTVLTP